MDVFIVFHKKYGNKPQEGRAYENVDAAYNGLGTFGLAIWYRKRALRRAPELGDGEGRSNCNLRNAYKNKGDFEKAGEHQLQKTQGFPVIRDFSWRAS